MIELTNKALHFSFPNLSPEASVEVSFQRTLRIPADGQSHPLPAGLGRFPLVHVDDLPSGIEVPEAWRRSGGVLLPMYSSEALWISFSVGWVDRRGQWPVAMKVAAGKINAISGEPLLQNGLLREPQDYVILPKQPWLDGFVAGRGIVRQFVAARLGEGRTVEEQAWGWAESGGIQLIAYPMSRESFERFFPMRPPKEDAFEGRFSVRPLEHEMGLGAGGSIKQLIYKDEYPEHAWAKEPASRVFIRLIHSNDWQRITGLRPPQRPITAETYASAGLPWFSEYSDGPVLEGSGFLAKVRGAFSRPAPHFVPASVPARRVIDVRTGKAVREGDF